MPNRSETFALINWSRRKTVERLRISAHREKTWFRNVIIVGFAYMLLVSAAQTSVGILTIILDSVNDEKFSGTSVMGYELLAIVYNNRKSCALEDNFHGWADKAGKKLCDGAISIIVSRNKPVLAASYWICQPVISRLGPKRTMLIGGALLAKLGNNVGRNRGRSEFGSGCFMFFISVFFRPLFGTIVVGALVAGVGTALLSTSAGVFLALNSTPKTVGRNSAIFFGLFQTSLIWGNIFFYFILLRKDLIDDVTRYWMFGYLLFLAVCGTILMVLLVYPVDNTTKFQDDDKVDIIPSRSLAHSFLASAAVFEVRLMLLLLPMMVYIGLESAFRVNIYQSCIGYTKSFPTSSTALLGLSGVCVGCGEIIGSILCAVLAAKFHRRSRNLLALTGIVGHLFAFLLVLINIPTSAIRGNTLDQALMSPNVGIALTASLLLGFGDSCITIQIYSLIGDIFSNDSVPAFAAFQFFGAVSVSIAYLLAGVLNLYALMSIFVVIGIAAVVSFVYAERTFWSQQSQNPPK